MKYHSPYKGLNKEEVVCLATNENPYALPASIQERLMTQISTTNRYPKVDNESLRQLIAQRHQVEAKNIVIGAGSDELITYTALKFVNPGDNTVMANPSFFRYKDLTELAGGTCKLVTGNHFCHDLGAMKESIDEHTKIVFLCNPNNPTGTFIPVEEIEAFVKEIRKDIVVVVDEAYFDYVYPKETLSSITLIQKYPNVLVFRTFSKYFALAGLRIGYAVGNEEVIAGLNAIRSPYNVNTIAQAAAIEVLKSSEYFDKTYYEEIQEERLAYYKAFNKLGTEYIQSQANFIFARLGESCEKICENLKKYNLIVRPCAMFGYPEYIRVTIGSPDENRKFLMALEEVLDKKEQV